MNDAAMERVKTKSSFERSTTTCESGYQNQSFLIYFICLPSLSAASFRSDWFLLDLPEREDPVQPMRAITPLAAIIVATIMRNMTKQMPNACSGRTPIEPRNFAIPFVELGGYVKRAFGCELSRYNGEFESAICCAKAAGGSKVDPYNGLHALS